MSQGPPMQHRLDGNSIIGSVGVFIMASGVIPTPFLEGVVEQMKAQDHAMKLDLGIPQAVKDDLRRQIKLAEAFLNFKRTIENIQRAQVEEQAAKPHLEVVR